MPNYKVRCESCNKVFEKTARVKDIDDIKCECGGNTKIIICPTEFQIFEPYWHPNLTSKPVWVKSKKHLKELDKKYNMTSYY